MTTPTDPTCHDFNSRTRETCEKPATKRILIHTHSFGAEIETYKCTRHANLWLRQKAPWIEADIWEVPPPQD